MLKRICKWAAPASLLLFVLLALYGAARPWPAAENALSIYRGQTHVLVGAGFKSTTTSTQNHRSYILFPAVLSDPSIVTVHQIDQFPVQVEIQPFAFLWLLIWLGLCVVGTWWFWFRKGGANVT